MATKMEWRIFEILLTTVQAVMVAFLSWMGVTLVSHGQRLSTMEANRYTSNDALVAEQARAESLLAVWQEISTVREVLASKADAQSVPSPETVRWMERLESRITAIEGAK